MADTTITGSITTGLTLHGTLGASSEAPTGTVVTGNEISGQMVGGPKGDKGDKGDAGVSVPVGGTTGQTLLKNSATDYDYSWATPPTAPVVSVAGKTGAVTLAKADVGLGSADNTSDLNKPISTATQSALNAKANASDTVDLTGDQTIAGVKTFSSSPVVPTATTSTQAVNKGQMDTALSGKVNITPLARKIYSTNDSGFQVTRDYSDVAAIAWSVVGRNANGQIVAADATSAWQSATKGQMDTADAQKVNKAGDTITGGTLIQYVGDVILGMQSTTATTGKRYNLISTAVGNFGIQDVTGTKTPLRITTDAPNLGIDIHSSGINIQGRGMIYGTGFPNGVVSAPVGSIYIDTAVTNGASSWIKKSGTGNTGWQVLEGDTGARNIPITNGTGYGAVIRVGNIVSFNFAGVGGDGPYGETELLNLPIGFRPPVNTLGMYGQGGGTPNKLMDIRLNGKVTLWSGVVSGQSMRSLGALYVTTDPWPVTLP